MPPRLPPRRPSDAVGDSSLPAKPHRLPSPYLSPNVPYSNAANHPYQAHNGIDDPRSSSTQSLRPDVTPGDARRKLLLIYIHGFMGSEASFKSFPAHVHSLLTFALADSHVIHTKIYPRYESRRDMSLVRDDFGNWLYPHEASTTDIILLGHSIGGILGAEVILEPNHRPGGQDLLQHRIIGLIAFDTPFLGMHPGVVSTGIASLFRGAPEEAAASPQGPSAENPSEFFDSSEHDPNFNPAFMNDIHKPVRKGKLERAWYFWNKHADDLGRATKSYVKSHFEFGGCLTDYPGLKRRYYTLRSLEDVQDLEELRGPSGKLLRRVRFVNYYTASTGRIKDERSPSTHDHSASATELQTMSSAKNTDNLLMPDSRVSTPRISLESNRNDGETERAAELSVGEPVSTPILSREDDEATPSLRKSFENDLPSIPPEPIKPHNFNPDEYLRSSDLAKAHKEYQVRFKEYEKEIKHREKAIKANAKAINNQKKALAKEQARATVQAAQEQKALEVKKLERQSTLNPDDYEKQIQNEIKAGRKPKDGKKKDRKFCALPAKDPNTGAVDSTWIRVYMEGMDEVVAHTSLFNMGDTYSKLVGDTAERIRDWVQEDATMQTLLTDKRLGALNIGN